MHSGLARLGGVIAHIRATFVALIATLALPIAAASAQDLSYLQRLPEIAEVEAAIQGENARDTAAQRAIACEILLGLTVDLAGAEYEGPKDSAGSTTYIQIREVTPQEYAVRQRFSDAVYTYLEQLPPRPARDRYITKYREDPAFKERVMSALFSADDRASFDRLIAKHEELLSRARAGDVVFVQDAGLNSLLNTAMRMPPMTWLMLFGGLTALFAFMDFAGYRVVWGAERPVIHARNKRTQIFSRTGHVVEAGKMSERHVTPGYTEHYSDGTSNYVAGTSYSVTKDQIFIIDPEGAEHALQLTNWNLAVRPGHRLSMLWLIKQGQKWGNYVAFRVHETRDTRFTDGDIKRAVRTSGKAGLWLWLGAPLHYFAIYLQSALTDFSTVGVGAQSYEQIIAAREATAVATAQQAVWLSTYPLAWVVFLICGGIVTANRMKDFKSNVAERIFEELGKKPPAAIIVGDTAITGGS